MPSRTINIERPFDKSSGNLGSQQIQGGSGFPNPLNVWVDPYSGLVGPRPRFLEANHNYATNQLNVLRQNFTSGSLTFNQLRAPDAGLVRWADATQVYGGSLDVNGEGLAPRNLNGAVGVTAAGGTGVSSGTLLIRPEFSTSATGHAASVTTLVDSDQSNVLLDINTLSSEAFLTKDSVGPYRAVAGYSYGTGSQLKIASVGSPNPQATDGQIFEFLNLAQKAGSELIVIESRVVQGRLIVLLERVGTATVPKRYFLSASAVGDYREFQTGGWFVDLGAQRESGRAQQTYTGMKSLDDKYLLVWGPTQAQVFALTSDTIGVKLVNTVTGSFSSFTNAAVEANGSIFLLTSNGVISLSQEVFRDNYKPTSFNSEEVSGAASSFAQEMEAERETLSGSYVAADIRDARSPKASQGMISIYCPQYNCILWHNRLAKKFLYFYLGSDLHPPYCSIWTTVTAVNYLFNVQSRTTAETLTGRYVQGSPVQPVLMALISTHGRPKPTANDVNRVLFLNDSVVQHVAFSYPTKFDFTSIEDNYEYAEWGVGRLSFQTDKERYAGVDLKECVLHGAWRDYAGAVTPLGAPNINIVVYEEETKTESTVNATPFTTRLFKVEQGSTPKLPLVRPDSMTNVGISGGSTRFFKPHPMRVQHLSGQGDYVTLGIRVNGPGTYRVAIHSMDLTFKYRASQKLTK